MYTILLADVSWHSFLYYYYYYSLLKKVGYARLGESDLYHSSPKTPPSQYKPMERKNKRENSRKQKYTEQVGQLIGIGPAIETRQFHTIKYRTSNIVPQR